MNVYVMLSRSQVLTAVRADQALLRRVWAAILLEDLPACSCLWCVSKEWEEEEKKKREEKQQEVQKDFQREDQEEEEERQEQKGEEAEARPCCLE